MPQDEIVYELSMIRDRLAELDKILSQKRPTIGIGGKSLDEKARLELAACVEKAIMVADAIAAEHQGQTLPAMSLPQQTPAKG